MHRVLTVQEYGEFTSLKMAADTLNIGREELWSLLLKALKKLSIAYPGQGFIETKGLDQFRFTDIAGIIALNARIHIEIVPKFLDIDNDSWKDDFLFLSVLTSQGFLFEKRLHSSSASSSNDLYEIIARIWIDKFERNQRKIIKTYIKTSWSDFALDGDTDEENIFLPNSEGFLQSGLKLSRANRHNETLLRSCDVLLNKIKNPGIAGRLSRAKSSLETALKEHYSGKQKQINISRNSGWSELLMLSELLIKNRSLSYFNEGSSLMPGFIVRTSDLWERLLFRTAKRAMPEIAITKTRYQIAKRIYRNGLTKDITSTPDISFGFAEGNFISDAKYKVVSDESATKQHSVISGSDFYESLAFMESSGTTRMLLLYPYKNSISDDPLADQPIEYITTRENVILAASLGLSGIGSSNGYKKFVENFRILVETMRQPETL